MGLQGALVDRARVVSSRKSGVRVEGRTVWGTVHEAWFKCRLEIETNPVTANEATGARVVARSANLLYGVRDLEGGELALVNEDRIQVNSRELGDELFDVDGDPVPLRKKRRVIGFEVPLRHVVVHEGPS